MDPPGNRLANSDLINISTLLLASVDHTVKPRVTILPVVGEMGVAL
jgi:hypothetical protein